ncbi:MAG: hypothetical protein ABJE95_06910 [Byssovorax sp.]
MAHLFSTPQITLTTEADSRLVRYVRTSVPYPTLAEYERLHERAGAALDQLGRKRHVLLVDMREAILNNDPAFERAAVRCRQLLVHDFRRMAVLVKTAVGALQIGRHIREDSLDAPVFNDETAAVSYLLGVSGFDADSPVSSQRSPRSSRRNGPGSGSER